MRPERLLFHIVSVQRAFIEASNVAHLVAHLIAVLVWQFASEYIFRL
jgi:hypothetical protein